MKTISISELSQIGSNRISEFNSLFSSSSQFDISEVLSESCPISSGSSMKNSLKLIHPDVKDHFQFLSPEEQIQLKKLKKDVNSLVFTILHSSKVKSEVKEKCEKLYSMITPNAISNSQSLFHNYNLYIPLVNCLLTLVSGKDNPKICSLTSFLSKLVRDQDQTLVNYIVNSEAIIAKLLKNLLILECFDESIRLFEELYVQANEPIRILRHASIINDIHLKYKDTKFSGLCRIYSCFIYDKSKTNDEFYLKAKLETKPNYENAIVLYHMVDFTKKIIQEIIQKFKTQKNINSYFKLFNRINQDVERLNAITNMPQPSHNLLEEATHSLLNSIGGREPALTSKENDNWKSTCIFFEEDLKVQSLSINLKRMNEALVINSDKQKLKCLISYNPFFQFEPDWILIKQMKDHDKIVRDNIFNRHKKLASLLKSIPIKSVFMNENQNVQITMLTRANQTELFFILSSILITHKGIEIQRSSISDELISEFRHYFSYIDWGDMINAQISNRFMDEEELSSNIANPIAYHGGGCKCEVDSTLKIQYLRTLYFIFNSDSDNFNTKVKLISSKELQSILCDHSYMTFIFSSLVSTDRSEQDEEIYNDMRNHLRCSGSVFFNETLEHRNTTLTKILLGVETLESDIQNLKNIVTCDSEAPYLESILSAYSKELKASDLDVSNPNSENDQVGFLSILCIRFLLECKHSGAKYWISNCIETILRGSNPLMQFHVMSMGLGVFIVNDIINTEISTDQSKDSILPQCLQMSFDLLAEIIKFNSVLLFKLSLYLVDKAEFSKFKAKLISEANIIDSNVFIRAVYLTIYHSEAKLEEDSQCVLTDLFLKHEADLFILLCSPLIIDPEKINQTNISCINTSLLILILKSEAYLKLQSKKLHCRSNSLVSFLREVRLKEADKKNSCLENLKLLLYKWRKYYYNKSKDAESLEFTTKIKFSMWKHIVAQLLNPDSTNEISLLYIPPEPIESLAGKQKNSSSINLKRIN